MALGTGPSIDPIPTNRAIVASLCARARNRRAEPAYPIVGAGGYRLWDCFAMYRLGGTLGHPTFDTDSRATLEWLDGALRDAHSKGQASLGVYLEAVLEEVLFEMEPESPSQSAFAI